MKIFLESLLFMLWNHLARATS